MTRLVVDGYNIMHAWPELARVMRAESLEEARRRLIARLAEYRATTGDEVLVVFDARFRPGGGGEREVVEGVEVRYGNARESADHVIERLMYEASRQGRVLEMVLATDDRLQRDLVAGMGVPTLSSRALREEVERADRERGGELRRRAEGPSSRDRLELRLAPEVRRRLEEMRRGGEPAGGSGGPGSGAGEDPPGSRPLG